MPSLRKRIANALLGEEKKQMEEAAQVFAEAYRAGPMILPPEQMIKRLQEVDSQYLDLLVRQLQTSSALLDYEASESDRVRTVYSSRRMYDNDVLTEAAINIWTNFGFGLNVSVKPRNKQAQKVWSEFWDDPQNSYVIGQRDIQELSIQLLKDGDFLIVFFTDKIKTGKTTLRVVPTEQIQGGDGGDGVITLPDDDTVPVLYRRQINIRGESKITYYQDWRVSGDMLKDFEYPEDGEVEGSAGTQVRAMLVTHRRRGHRGWPLMTTGLTWSVTYRDFLQDRAAVARAIASVVNKVSVDGGQRAVDAITAKLQSAYATGAQSETNPKPTAGSTWIENKAATLERLPMGSGAGDAATDSSSILSQAALSANLYAHWVGRGESYRLATASSMEQPLLRAFNRYQLLWSSVWRDIATYVLTAAELYGGKRIPDKTVDISTDTIIDIKIADVSNGVTALGNLVDRALVPSYTAGKIAEQLMRVMVVSLGVGDTDDVFTIPPEEKKKEEEVPTKKPPTQQGTPGGNGSAPEGGEEEEPPPGYAPGEESGKGDDYNTMLENAIHRMEVKHGSRNR